MNRPPSAGRGPYRIAVMAASAVLALALLGLASFSLSWQYALSRAETETAGRARALARLCEARLGERGKASLTDLSDDPDLRRAVGAAAAVSGSELLLCDPLGRVVLASDADLEGRTVSVSVTAEILGGGTPSVRGDLGVFPSSRLAAGTGASDPRTGALAGAVFAASVETDLIPSLRASGDLFLLLLLVVGPIALLVAAVPVLRLTAPLREMVHTARRYADGDLSGSMDGIRQDGEIGELAAAFEKMAGDLRRQEEQRRDLIANVSHDLKTPLTTIAGYTDGILDGTIPPEDERTYLQIISDESRRLSRLVRRMLAVSQIQSVDPLRSGASFDLCERTRRVLLSLEERITGRGLDVQADIPEEAVLVLGDEDLMTQVIYNLLDNAAKFAREGSVIFVSVRPEGDRARVTVRDEGETIPPEELPRLFDRFHKGDRSRSEDRDGVGLGLYIVKTILDQHREKIFVTSEAGVTTFSFSLEIDQIHREVGAHGAV